MNSLISVIIPTYNQGDFLPRAIKSVLEQTFQNFELIIVDDASTDNTEEVVKKFQEEDERIKYKRHQKNKGGNAARNTGLRNAKGEYIAFLDSDDEWLSRKLEKQLEVFEKPNNANLALVYSGAYYIENGKMAIKVLPKKRGHILKDLLVSNCIMAGGSSSLIRREVFNNCGYFDECKELREGGGQEYEMWIRIAQKYECDFVKEELIKYYIHERSITKRSDLYRKKVRQRYIFNKYKNYYQKSPKLYSTRLKHDGAGFTLQGYPNEGRRRFIKSIRTYPLNIKSYLCLFLSLFGSNTYAKVLELKNKLEEKR